MSLVLLLSVTAPAIAGSGPWVLTQGDDTLYLGIESQRYTQIAGSSGGFFASDGDLEDGISSFGGTAILSYGLLPRIELEMSVPWAQVRANRTDNNLCDYWGQGACKTTRGIGEITARGKSVLVDELYGRLFSLTIGGEVRYGEFVADVRDRLTNLGEGTTDVGGFLSIGRSGAAWQGYWSAYAEGGYRYRFPNTYMDDQAIPGSEWNFQSECFIGPQVYWALGPSFDGLFRPGGVDLGDVDTADIDRFSSLRVGNVNGGLKLLLRGEEINFVAGATRTLYARNNPSDTWIVSLGVQTENVIRRRREG